MCVGILKLTVLKSKADYNGEEAAIKVLQCWEGKVNNTHLQNYLRNERMILEKLKDETKSAEELGYIKLYDYIEDGRLVRNIEKEEKTPEQCHHKSSDGKKVDKSAITSKKATAATTDSE